MKRREFVSAGAVLTLGFMSKWTPLSLLRARSVMAHSGFSLEQFLVGLDPKDGTIFEHKDSDFSRLSKVPNKRFECLQPKYLFRAKTADGIALALRWCRENKINFTVRSGGHSYEGLSVNKDFVIDVREMNGIDFDASKNEVVVESGANLGQIYKIVSQGGHAFAGGSCPTVGIGGHATGGGIGYMVRQLGMAMDNILWLEVIGPTGNLIRASADENSELFWALRGGGQGSFGIISRMGFRTHKMPKVLRYSWEATLPMKKAVEFLWNWQNLVIQAPKSLSYCILSARKNGDSMDLQFSGIATLRLEELNQFFQNLLRPAKLKVREMTFAQAFEDFKDSDDYEKPYAKQKSDMVKKNISREGLEQICNEISENIGIEINALGGAMNDLNANETAFPYRADTLFLIEWDTYWERAEDSASRLKEMDVFYQSIRPYMSSSCYLNYIDSQPDWVQKYWGANANRLVQLKQKYDPDNIFRHAMSVPLQMPLSSLAPKISGCESGISEACVF